MTTICRARWNAGCRGAYAAFTRERRARFNGVCLAVGANDCLGSNNCFDAATASAKFEAYGATGERVERSLAQAFKLIVFAITAVLWVLRGLAKGWDLIQPGVDVLRDALGQLGPKLGEVTAYLRGTSLATQESSDSWTALGETIAVVVGVIVSTIGVLVAVISAAVSIISAAIQIVIAVFSGLADVITGVVFIIGGIVNGSWTDVWMGLKLVAFGVVDAIIAVVLELAGAIAGVVDAMTSLVGENTEWQKSVRDFRESLRADLADGMGVGELSFTQPTRPSALPVGPPPLPTGTMPAVAALPPADASAAPFMWVPPPAQPAQPIVVNVQIDGETVASAVHNADRSSASRGYLPAPTY